MRKYKTSQICAIDITGFVGSVDESGFVSKLRVTDKDVAEKP
jgi:cystathionine beta-synthase